MKELKLRLRELREESKRTQEEMAKNIGCSQQTYSRYELHTTELPLQKLIFLAEFYHTSTDYLLGITDCREPYPDNVK